MSTIKLPPAIIAAMTTTSPPGGSTLTNGHGNRDSHTPAAVGEPDPVDSQANHDAQELFAVGGQTTRSGHSGCAIHISVAVSGPNFTPNHRTCEHQTAIVGGGA